MRLIWAGMRVAAKARTAQKSINFVRDTDLGDASEVRELAQDIVSLAHEFEQEGFATVEEAAEAVSREVDFVETLFNSHPPGAHNPSASEILTEERQENLKP